MIINGRNPVLEALRSEKNVEKIYVLYGVEGDAVSEIRAEAKRRDVPVSTADRRRFSSLEREARVKGRSQGVLAVMSVVDYVDPAIPVALAFEAGRAPLVGVLDRITDPHNVGAIIRSAEAAGVDCIVIGKEKSGGVNDTVMKTSAGAAAHLPIARVSSLETVLKDLKSSGLQIIGLDERGDSDYTDVSLIGPTAVVIGSEGEGMTRQVRQACDLLVRIPMAGKTPSLNASVAASLMFFEGCRQRASSEVTP